MNGERFNYFKSDITGEYVISDSWNYKTFSGFVDEDKFKKIVDLLNDKSDLIIIKEKLLDDILDYNRIADLNYYEGYNVTLQKVKTDIEKLFENPFGFKVDDDGEV